MAKRKIRVGIIGCGGNMRGAHVPRVKETSPDAVFFRWIRSGGKGYEAPDYALQVARLSEAAYKSVQMKKPVKVARS